MPHAAPETAPPAAPTRGRGRRGRSDAPLVLLIITVGLAILLYPVAADWFSSRNHNSEITGYRADVEGIAPAERAAELQLADAYNAHMPQGLLRDPYSSAPVTDAEQDEAYESYEQILQVSDRGVIGAVRYPALGISLPLSHGTSDEVISRGAGHLYGSSLPVGGPSTHSVLTAHSGLAHARLFTPLVDGAKVGQVFSVEVLGEKHFYEVRAVDTVLPSDTQSLKIEADRDLVTLITCAPIGVNSHRLLVRGERIPAPEGAAGALDGDDAGAGFPWWAVGLLGGAGLTAGALLWQRKRRDASRDGARGGLWGGVQDPSRDADPEAPRPADGLQGER